MTSSLVDFRFLLKAAFDHQIGYHHVKVPKNNTYIHGVNDDDDDDDIMMRRRGRRTRGRRIALIYN